jgi:hypothetical protein
MMPNNDPTLPVSIVWRRPLLRPRLTDGDRQYIEDRLQIQIYGYRKPEAYNVGFRVLYEIEGRADLLLLRRNFTGAGFFFDLDRALGEIGDDESAYLRHEVDETINVLRERPLPEARPIPEEWPPPEEWRYPK